MAPTVRLKAVVYCVRGDELLVFTQPHALMESGVQVPAGTVREGEPPLDAARRELSEETGRGDLVVERLLGVARYDQRPYRDEIHERHFFLARASGSTPDRWSGAEAHDGLAPETAFDFFWIPLRLGHVLAAGQGALLGLAAEALTETAS